MQISTASIYDHVALNANIRAIYQDRYKCSSKLDEIRSRVKDKDAADKRVENYKVSRGCGRVVNHVIDRIGPTQYNTCLCSIKHPLTGSLLTISRHYENGVMPFSGALLEQPAQVIDLLEIVGTARGREELKLQEDKKNG